MNATAPRSKVFTAHGRGQMKRKTGGRIIRRRDLVAMLVAVSMGRPGVSQAQRSLRQFGVLLAGAVVGNPAAQRDLDIFHAALHDAGWIEGKTIHVEYRLPGPEPANIAAAAAQLVALKPDVIFAVGTPAVEAIYRDTKTIPVVFAEVADPIGEGWIKSFARPGGNMTGFTAVAGSQGGKFIQLLLEMAPATARVGLIYNPKTMPYAPPFVAAARQAAGSAISVVVCEVVSRQDIDRCLSALASGGQLGAAVVMPDHLAQRTLRRSCRRLHAFDCQRCMRWSSDLALLKAAA